MFGDVRWIERDRPGRLGIIPSIHDIDWLEENGWKLKESGIDEVVSLLTDQEVEELQLGIEKDALERHGIGFRRFAIEDRKTPPMNGGTLDFFEALLKETHSGRGVAVHCNKGVGRSAVVIASLLTLEGEHPDDAMKHVGRDRLRSVPQTDEQKEWIRQFAHQANPYAIRRAEEEREEGPSRLLLGAGLAGLIAIGIAAAIVGYRRRAA